ncbi:MAG: FAS1-like dehydratase domain-containing protein [Planctomycetota bacterium]|jgi:acyl dehydratase
MASSSSETSPSPRRVDEISDEGVAKLRMRIGIPVPSLVSPHYRVPNEDAIRHFAHAVGDDNPLWCDAEYAKKTKWKGTIAIPSLVGGDCVVGMDEITEIPQDKKSLMKGDPLRGVHAFYSGMAREWWAPLRPGHTVWKREALVGVLDKKSEFAERAIHEWSGQVFRDDLNTLLAAQYRLMIRTERKKAVAKGKYKEVELKPYSSEQLAEIDAQYASEKPRGAEARLWEDVREGDEIEPRVKGPLTVTDMICWHMGVGMGSYGVAGLRLGYWNRQRIPRFYHPNELGVPDAAQRCHWDQAFAREAGNPYSYDYGRMRETWLIHLCTDWMGDDGWLWKLDAEMRRFNFVGDTHWMRGRITRKYLAEGNRPAVDLDVWGENQRGEVTTPGHATILLPSQKYGDVKLPPPPGGATDLQAALQAIVESFSRE